MVNETVESVEQAVSQVVHDVERFARLERILALLLILCPAVMIWGDNGNVRGSISAYYSMAHGQFFYVPLVMASMLFVCNGHLLEARAYNSWLGYSLLGVVLFNHIDWTYVHHTFASIFFVGNAVVMVIYSPRSELVFKLMICGVIAVSTVAFLIGWISLLAMEWISLTLISAHYVLESKGFWH